MTEGLCPDCQARKQAKLDKGDPVVTVPSGWCAPNVYDFFKEECYIYHRPEFKDWFKRRMLRHPLINWRRWQEMGEDEGMMVHGYRDLFESLPPISAKRGGIKFHTAEDKT